MCSPINVTSSKINLYSPVDEDDLDIHTVNTRRCECSMNSSSKMEVYLVNLRLLYNSNSEDLPAMHETLTIISYTQNGTVSTWFPQYQLMRGFTVRHHFIGSVAISFVKESNLRLADFHLILTGK